MPIRSRAPDARSTVMCPSGSGRRPRWPCIQLHAHLTAVESLSWMGRRQLEERLSAGAERHARLDCGGSEPVTAVTAPALAYSVGRSVTRGRGLEIRGLSPMGPSGWVDLLSIASSTTHAASAAPYRASATAPAPGRATRAEARRRRAARRVLRHGSAVLCHPSRPPSRQQQPEAGSPPTSTSPQLHHASATPPAPPPGQGVPPLAAAAGRLLRRRARTEEHAAEHHPRVAALPAVRVQVQVSHRRLSPP